MTQMDLFEVAGTTFRFPKLPDEPGNIAVVRATEHRVEILTKARKVKREKTAWKAPRETRIKPGDGVFVPKADAPGSRITLSDGREAEVWSAAPAPRSVWALLDDGTCVEVSLGYANRVRRTWKWEAQVRAERVTRAADKDNRARSMAYAALDSAGLDYREQQFERARAWALTWISYEMFPEHYPAPDPFTSEAG